MAGGSFLFTVLPIEAADRTRYTKGRNLSNKKELKKMAILVCGGAGYVGSHCLEGLRQAGFDCIVVDNLTRGHRAAVGDTPLYVGDISDPAFDGPGLCGAFH